MNSPAATSSSVPLTTVDRVAVGFVCMLSLGLIAVSGTLTPVLSRTFVDFTGSLDGVPVFTRLMLDASMPVVLSLAPLGILAYGLSGRLSPDARRMTFGVAYLAGLAGITLYLVVMFLPLGQLIASMVR